MKTEKNILVAFILNLSFSIFEIIGGFFTGSVAIISDAIHDLGDATSIGNSYFLERISKKQPDETHTYGYTRYSVMGSVITTFILLFGSMMVIYNAVYKMINPTEINYDGMIAFAIVGVIVNFCAAYFTRKGDSLNQKAVNLHMLEDVLGWTVVLIGAIIMRFTGFALLDPLMSIGVALFILVNAMRTLKSAVDLFLVKTPNGTEINEIKEHVMTIEGVIDVHHIHIWSMDMQSNYATMHIVTNANSNDIKHKIRKELKEHNIRHTTLEFEFEGEHCDEVDCHVDTTVNLNHHHHHHHH